MNGDKLCRTSIDELYAAFVYNLPIELRIGAERLPRRLGLSFRGDVGWGEVFDDVPRARTVVDDTDIDGEICGFDGAAQGA